METNKELLQFIMEEVEKLHKITLLETKKLEIEGQLKLLKEESAAEDINQYRIEKQAKEDAKKAKEKAQWEKSVGNLNKPKDK